VVGILGVSDSSGPECQEGCISGARYSSMYLWHNTTMILDPGPHVFRMVARVNVLLQQEPPPRSLGGRDQNFFCHSTVGNIMLETELLLWNTCTDGN